MLQRELGSGRTEIRMELCTPHPSLLSNADPLACWVTAEFMKMCFLIRVILLGLGVGSVPHTRQWWARRRAEEQDG